jgi:hypothetical protein
MLISSVVWVLQEFEGHVLKCVHDQNGNHVIQKCIEVLSLKAKEYPEYASFLIPQVRRQSTRVDTRIIVVIAP